jgi:hypothetical protein
MESIMTLGIQTDPSFNINGRALQASLLSRIPPRDGAFAPNDYAGTLSITYPGGQHVRFDLLGNNKIEASVDGSILSEANLRGTGLTMQGLRADAVALMASPEFRQAHVGQIVGLPHQTVTGSFYDSFRTRLQQWRPSTATAPSPVIGA